MTAPPHTGGSKAFMPHKTRRGDGSHSDDQKGADENADKGHHISCLSILFDRRLIGAGNAFLFVISS